LSHKDEIEPELYIKIQHILHSKHIPSVNAVKGNTDGLFWDPYKTHKCNNEDKMYNFLMLKIAVCNHWVLKGLGASKWPLYSSVNIKKLDCCK